MSGTGAYAGISGSVDLTAQLAILLSKTKAGACNTGANSTSALRILGRGDRPGERQLLGRYQRGDQLLVRRSLLSHWSRSSSPLVM